MIYISQNKDPYEDHYTYMEQTEIENSFVVNQTEEETETAAKYMNKSNDVYLVKIIKKI